MSVPSSTRATLTGPRAGSVTFSRRARICRKYEANSSMHCIHMWGSRGWLTGPRVEVRSGFG